MASCTFHRLDSTNTTDNLTRGKFASKILEDPNTGELMVAWIEKESIRFARFDPETRLPNSEVEIAATTSVITIKAIDMVDCGGGVYVVAFYDGPTGNVTVAYESSDSGANWGPQTIVSGLNEFLMGLYFNGTDVILTVYGQSSGGVGTGDGKAYRRTAAATWTQQSARFYDCDTSDNDPGRIANIGAIQAPNSMYMASSTSGLLVGWCSTDGANDSKKLTAWTTTDAFATATRVTIHTFTANNGAGIIEVNADLSGRVWLVTTDIDNNDKPRVFYTDDVGATWTDAGIPTAVTDEMAALGETALDAGYDVSYAMDVLGNLVIFHSTGTSPNPGTHVSYRSSDATNVADWSVVGLCSYIPTGAENLPAGTGTSRGFVDSSGTLWRLMEMNRTSTLGGYTLEFLAVEDAGSSTEPDSPAVVEASSADDNNLYLRNNVAEGGGWSAHTHPVAYFMDWDEGDAETGREIPILLAANPSMDPAIQDPAYIPAFTRINDPGSYTRRTYTTGSDGLVVIPDPLPFKVVTPEYTITKEFEYNAGRAVAVEWILDGDSTPTVQVWIDGKLNRTIELSNTYGQLKSQLFSLSAFANVGEKVQFVIEDLSPYFFAIETVSLTYIEKGMRG